VSRLAGTCDARGSALLPGYTDCQTLPETQYCAAGLCTTCAPNCAGRECGDDGCGGNCGACADKHECLPNGTCVWDIEALGNKWVAIPGGTFMMGCSPGDTACLSDEKPAHQVTVSAFLMFQTEVTEEQYFAVIGAKPSCRVNNPTGVNLPVECVDWYQSRDFCLAVGGRMPTEAEWEYAARAGSTTVYFCGTDSSCLVEYEWLGDWGGNTKRTVAQKKPNGFGLYDLLGNVGEWTNDWFAFYSSESQVDPEGPATGKDRTMRGGYFGSPDDYWGRSSRRQLAFPTVDTNSLGFRCVR
jgi:formylglycine-generating enzyme required for sulfatase activity